VEAGAREGRGSEDRETERSGRRRRRRQAKRRVE
jgi:hypothetical protein